MIINPDHDHPLRYIIYSTTLTVERGKTPIFLGGIGLLALEMGRDVPPACSKPDPVAIRLMAKKTPCPDFANINTEFDWLVYGAISTNILHVLWSF